MRRILLLTDFSDHALNAAEFAVRLYGTEDTAFTLLHAFLSPNSATAQMWAIDEMLMKENVEGLRLVEEKLRQRVDLGASRIDRVCEHGDLPNVVDRLTAERGFDVVVTGAQGTTGLERVFFGSNAADVLARSHVPVLVVPGQARYEDPRRIILADDGRGASAASIRPLLDIARWHKAEVMIVRVVAEEAEDSASSTTSYDELMGAIPHSHHTVSGDNVVTALHDLADQSDAHLIAMLHRRRGVFDQIFHRSSSKRMVMHTHIPMLVLEQ